MALWQLTAIEDILPWALHHELLLMLIPSITTYLKNTGQKIRNFIWCLFCLLHMKVNWFQISWGLCYLCSKQYQQSLLEKQRRKSCVNISFQGTKGKLSLPHLMNLVTRPHAIEIDLSNPLAPLTFSYTDYFNDNHYSYTKCTNVFVAYRKASYNKGYTNWEPYRLDFLKIF